MSKMNANWNMLGHEWAVDLLRGHLTNERQRHAYLFTGPQGIGRRTLAIRLAQALNCTAQTAPGHPCGKCRACRLIGQVQHPDFSLVQAPEVGKALKVDQIRGLQRTLSLSPYEANHKIALLLRFEEANPSAANALLKTLEEPPPQVIILMTASDGEALLPTIVSRCEIIRLRPLSLDQVSDGLQTRWGLPASEANLLAHLSGGRPGFALKLHQNPDLLEERQTHLEAHKMLLKASRVERFSHAETLAKDRRQLSATLLTWLTLWRDIMLKSTGSSVALTNIDCLDEIDHLAANIDQGIAKKTISHLERALDQIEHYLNARLVIEVLMLDLPRLP